MYRILIPLLLLGAGTASLAAVPAMERPATKNLVQPEKVYWHHGWHGGRIGWWWVTPGYWYYYPQPIYPYPMDPPVAPVQQPVGPPPPQSWYYCSNPKGYYPYVNDCPGGWQAVPATPTNAPPR